MVRFTVRCAAGLHQQRQFAQDFVECQLREERQGALDHQPLLRCERQKIGLIARIQTTRRLTPRRFRREVSVPVLSVVVWFRRTAIVAWNPGLYGV